MLTYLSSVALISSSFIVYSPLVITAFMETADSVKAFLDKNPNFPLLSMAKDTFVKGIQFRG
jgi:hypothetical protein